MSAYLRVTEGQVLLQVEGEVKAAIARPLTGRNRGHNGVDVVGEGEVLLAAAPAHGHPDLGAVDLRPRWSLTGGPRCAMDAGLTGKGCTTIAERAGDLLIQALPLQQIPFNVALVPSTHQLNHGTHCPMLARMQAPCLIDRQGQNVWYLKKQGLMMPLPGRLSWTKSGLGLKVMKIKHSKCIGTRGMRIPKGTCEVHKPKVLRPLPKNATSSIQTNANTASSAASISRTATQLGQNRSAHQQTFLLAADDATWQVLLQNSCSMFETVLETHLQRDIGAAA